jgi:hypothetical protein
MRFNQQGIRPMTTTPEQKAGSKPHIEKGAEIFAELEASAKEDIDLAKGLIAVYEAIRDLDIIKPFECKALKMETRALFASHEAAIWALHNRLVRRCDDFGIDVPPAAGDPDLPQPQSGGGSR